MKTIWIDEPPQAAVYQSLTLREIIAIEPRLVSLLSEARGYRRSQGADRHRHYTRLKRQLDSLCGRNSRHEAFSDFRNYDTAHAAMCEAMNY